ncbi:MAG: YlcI/YnfO family protein [Actinomycetaceae bacterium]|nr:YlcI/YnfO family protein [Actinomycetaceae bacterium]
MSTELMSPEHEYGYYAKPENQEPQGPPLRRSSPKTSPIAVRFPPDVLTEVRERAHKDDRSVSSWIRLAVERELNRTA